MAEPYNPVLAGAGYVHALMIQRFGLAVEHVGVIDQGAYVWFMKPPGRPSFLIRFTRAALLATKPELDRWLDAVADDVGESPLRPPGFYVVDPAGIRAMGMDDLEFEKYGQRVHLYVDLGPPKVWRMEIDAVDCGVLGLSMPQDVRDEIALRAIMALTVSGHLRVPAKPWEWSVVDGQGREWWARLALPFESRDPPTGPQLWMHDVTTGREHQLPWEQELPPDGAELRRLVGLASG